MDDKLRIVAVSAPENESGGMPAERIYSRDPASLFNAMRVAAMRSNEPGNAWSDSNFSGSRKERREKLQLMYSLDDMPAFEALLKKERPHVLFLGAMSLALPGAIECAKKAREILGDDVLIVLGGRHTSETIYKGPDKKVKHHAGSPLKLMAEGKIPEGLFDLVVSGYAEHLVDQIGEIANSARQAGNVRNIKPYLDAPPTSEVSLEMDGAWARRHPYANGLKNSPGDWTIGYVDQGKIHTISDDGRRINYNSLTSPTKLFGVSSSFDVFDGNPTAHVYSDVGMGCVYSCDFCSEAASVIGKPIDRQGAPDRLYKQLRDAAQVIHEDHDKPASAFVEDSVFLGGQKKEIERFCELMETQPVDIKFGAQFTVDQILKNKAQFKRLQKAGLSYVFMGIETYDPKEIGGMSKAGSNGREWIDRTKEAVEFLDSVGIKTGAALLFGLGESQQSRMKLLDTIEEIQKISPTALRPVSANIAVQHPLKGHDGGANYDYVEWGTPSDSAYNPYMHHFGEIAERYPMRGKNIPSVAETKEICARLEKLNTRAPKVRLEQGFIYPPHPDKISNGRLPVIAATQAGFPSVAAYQAASSDTESPLHYGGLGTPTDKKLASVVAEMEGGKHAILTPTGQAAMAHTLGAILKPGDHILVVDSAIYSTKQYFCDAVLRRMGVEVEYYDPAKGEDINTLIRDNTKAIYMESPSSYTHEIQQVDAITKAAKRHHVTTIMDNTWSASTFFKPFEHGVDVSVVSLGKYHFGPAAVPMGAVITKNSALYQDIKQHGLSWGNRVSVQDAKTGWGALQTLEDRLKRQQDAASDVATYLETRPEVKAVLHPPLASFPQHDDWKRDFTGSSSLIPIEFRTGLPKGYAVTFQDELAKQGMVTVGDGYGGSFSLVNSFDPKRGRQASKPKQEGECIRLYVGHEDPKQIKNHVQRALEKANREHGI